MHTISLAVPVYRKANNWYILEKCVNVTNARQQPMSGMSLTQSIHTLKMDATSSIAIIVLKGDTSVVGTCQQQKYTMHREFDLVSYSICNAVSNDSNDKVVVDNQTALIVVDADDRIASQNAMFDHNTAFVTHVPACRIETYIDNVCQFQNKVIHRLLKNVACYRMTNSQISGIIGNVYKLGKRKRA